MGAAITGAKLCSRCRMVRPHSEFNRRAGSKKDGRAVWCKGCYRNYNKIKPKRAYKPPPPQEVRAKNYAKNFGITIEDYDKMFAAQGGRCAICGTADPGHSRVKNLTVDHDHDTGRVRGLLCGPCNRGIGMFKESASIVERAAEYIRGR